ncbi:hypothetical protein [Desulfonema magnum]|uniref:Uncharacterized protein n=1 Tax=Desulfonema magnum TaxID=45655 RepID=A0A975GTF1_9BACT|nr:hypothetical protein [Desulfonema magnum]QTA92083.1 Uncharacterized protein dnm_081570 [Desulfonema magnum]
MTKFFEKLCSHSVLKAAWHRVRQKGAAGGLDRIRISDLEPDIGKTISSIIKDLRSKKYSPVPYEKGSMPKFNEANEWRKLSEGRGVRGKRRKEKPLPPLASGPSPPLQG